MFYSTELLSKTGALAKEWLAANQEKKLSKVQILQHNLQDSVDTIMQQNQAPLALRLFGHLLLGCVRIYSRKARYLLDDCNEALVKLKMAFRTGGNHDIQAPMHAATATTHREALIIPDRITPYDGNLDVLPELMLSQMDDTPNASLTQTPLAIKNRMSNSREINLQEDYNNSQFLQDNTPEDGDPIVANMDDLDLELDFGEGIDDGATKLGEKSLELGREAPAMRSVEDEMLTELPLAGPSKDRTAREPSLGLDLDFGEGIRVADKDGDIPMVDDDFHLMDDPADIPGAQLSGIPDLSRARISESPLSDVDEQFAAEVEMEVSRFTQGDMYEPVDETITQNAPQRAKKRKLLQPDERTMLSSALIIEQQTSRANILKPPSFLSQDPYVVGLTDMQKNGGFVANVLLEGRSNGWAPELQGLLTLSSSWTDDLKRKRDSGVADLDSDLEQHASKSPRLELPEDETALAVEEARAQQGRAADGTVLGMAGSDEMLILPDDDNNFDASSRSLGPNFEDTTAPLVHPADSGPVSLGTKHAVHILRDLFGEEAANDEALRRDKAVVFQDLLPEERTSKADATKMFFECLVLATKDAIKVQQPGGALGGPISVRAKRGLWGDWAEREAGGEMANQEQQEQEQQQQPQEQPQQPQSDPSNAPEPAVASSTIVSVEA